MLSEGDYLSLNSTDSPDVAKQVFWLRTSSANAVQKARMTVRRLAKAQRMAMGKVPKAERKDAMQLLSSYIGGATEAGKMLTPELRDLGDEVRAIQDSQSREILQLIRSSLGLSREEFEDGLEDADKLNKLAFKMAEDLRREEQREHLTDTEYREVMTKAIAELVDKSDPEKEMRVQRARELSVAATIKANIGTWQRRVYMAHLDPKWSLRIWDQNANNGRGAPGPDYKKYVPDAIAELRDEDPRLEKWPDERIFNEIIMPMLFKDAGAFFSLSASQGEVTQAAKAALKKRRRMGPAMLGLLGEAKNPALSYMEGIVRQRQLVEAAHLQNALRTVGDGVFFWTERDTAPQGATEEIQIGTVVGKDGTLRSVTAVTFKPVADALTDAKRNAWTNQYWWLRGWMRAVGGVKWGLTVGNPGTHMRNMAFWIEGSLRAGYNPMIMWRAIPMILSGRNDAASKLLGFDGWQDMSRQLEDSVAYIGGGSRAGYAREAATQLTEGRLESERPTGRGRSIPGKAINSLTELYEMEDLFPRFLIFRQEVERQRQKDPTASEEELKRRAGEQVRRTTPSWDMAAPVTRAMRQIPFLFPFPTFTAEWWRSAMANAHDAAVELRSGNATEMRHGTQRLIGLATTMTLMPMAGQMLAEMLGFEPVDDDEEDKGLRMMVPEWSEHQRLSKLVNKETGMIAVIDWSSMFPSTGYLEGPFRALINDGPSEAALVALQENMNLQLEPAWETGQQMLEIIDEARRTPGQSALTDGVPEALAHAFLKSGPFRGLLRAAWAGQREARGLPTTNKYGRTYDAKEGALKQVSPVSSSSYNPRVSFQNVYKETLSERSLLMRWMNEPKRNLGAPESAIEERKGEAEAIWQTETWPKLVEQARGHRAVLEQSFEMSPEKATFEMMQVMKAAGVAERFRMPLVRASRLPQAPKAPPLTTPNWKGDARQQREMEWLTQPEQATAAEKGLPWGRPPG